jgi:cutinase
MATNKQPSGTDEKSIKIGTTAFQRAAQACPIIVAGGYSQGAAIMHNVIPRRLSPDILSRIVGVVLYGDTRNRQDNGIIPGFPVNRVRMFCNSNDGVCGGKLVINAGHLAYANQIAAGANFLAESVRAFGSGGGRNDGQSFGGGSQYGGGEAMEAPVGGIMGKLGGGFGKGGKRGGGARGGLFGKRGS